MRSRLFGHQLVESSGPPSPVIGFAVGIGIGSVGFCFRSVRMREHGLHSRFILLNQMFIVGGDVYCPS